MNSFVKIAAYGVLHTLLKPRIITTRILPQGNQSGGAKFTASAQFVPKLNPAWYACPDEETAASRRDTGVTCAWLTPGTFFSLALLF